MCNFYCHSKLVNKKNRKIVTFFKEPVKFPIFFIKFWFRIVHCVWKKCENQIYIVHVEYIHMYQHFLVCYQEFFSWNWPSYFFCDLCTKCITFQYLSNKMKKKYLRPFQDYMMSVLTYLQNALSNQLLYLFSILFLFPIFDFFICLVWSWIESLGIRKVSQGISRGNRPVTFYARYWKITGEFSHKIFLASSNNNGCFTFCVYTQTLI